jgi:hypothetical protein
MILRGEGGCLSLYYYRHNVSRQNFVVSLIGIVGGRQSPTSIRLLVLYLDQPKKEKGGIPGHIRGCS